MGRRAFRIFGITRRTCLQRGRHPVTVGCHMLPSLPRFLCIFAVLSGLLPGCTTTPATPDQLEAPPDEIASVVDQGLVPAARYGRYTLVELVPAPAQRDLLQQAVEVRTEGRRLGQACVSTGKSG